MQRELTFYVPEEETGARLDSLIARFCPELTRSAAQKLLESGAITVGSTAAAKNYRVRAGDGVRILLPEPVDDTAQPERIPLDIVYEDDDLLVVNKPKGMVVHPAAGNRTGTLVNALLAHCGSSLSGINGVIRPGIVHRIDKDTSGLLIVAKNDAAHQSLAAQIKAHSFTREYQAVVYGNLRQNDGTVDAPIGRSTADRTKMAVTEKNSRGAVTHYHVLARYDGFTHVALRLETGRTHQIRVHMAWLGHPVAGDPVYGPKKVIAQLRGQCLHAGKIGFEHPRTGEWMDFESALPPYFTTFLSSLGEPHA